MIFGDRTRRGAPRPAWLLALFPILLAVSSAQAQEGALSVDRTRSMAWWQLDPHFGHLWATTCPHDPSWQPGEGHSGRYRIDHKSRPKYKLTKEAETRLPLFPRDTVRANCRRALQGQFSAANIQSFAGLKGVILLDPDSITNGSDMRDAFADKYVYASNQFPTIKFTVDSLTSVAAVGDTVTAIAVGTFVLRGVERPTRVQVQGVREGGALRVRGMFAIPARELRERYNVSKIAMGLGVGMKLWETLFMGFDLILTEQPAKASQ